MAPIRYLESYPNLPPSAPVGHPHIISTAFSESTPKDGLTAADGIATLFFNWKPDALAAFLDVDAVPQFEFVRKEERVAWMNTYVARFGRRVMCGFTNRHGDWDPQLWYRIEEDGRWTPLNSESDYMSDGFAKAIMYQKRYKEDKDVEMQVYLGEERRF